EGTHPQDAPARRAGGAHDGPHEAAQAQGEPADPQGGREAREEHAPVPGNGRGHRWALPGTVRRRNRPTEIRPTLTVCASTTYTSPDTRKVSRYRKDWSPTMCIQVPTSSTPMTDARDDPMMTPMKRFPSGA